MTRETYAERPRPLQLSYVTPCEAVLRNSRIGRSNVLRASTTAFLLVSGLSLASPPASAMQAIVTQIDMNKDGTATSHFSVDVDIGETLAPGEGKATGDFVTVYNFYGFVEGSAKSSSGWTISSEEFGRTPTANGYPLVLPLDVPNTPNLTWTVSKPVTAGARIDGFTATTRVRTIVQGEYAAQVSRAVPAVGGAETPMPKQSRQALIGTLPTPTFLAVVK